MITTFIVLSLIWCFICCFEIDEGIKLVVFLLLALFGCFTVDMINKQSVWFYDVKKITKHEELYDFEKAIELYDAKKTVEKLTTNN